MNAGQGARLLAAGLASMLALGLPATAGEHGIEALRAVLRRGSASASRTPVELATSLAGLDPGAVPLLYGLVTGRELDALVGEEWRPADWHCLPEEIPGLCLRALERAPAPAVFAHLGKALDAGPTQEERLSILHILGARGSGEGLALVLRNARDLGPLELGRPRVRGALCDALTAILDRDERAWSEIEKRIDDLELATCEVLVEAIGAAGRARGMDLLEHLFRRAELDPERVIEAVVLLEVARPWELAGRTLELIRPWLRSQDGSRRALAARLLGRVHALDELHTLIALTGDGDPLVRRCAGDAVRAMAGLPLTVDPEALAAWHEREEVWYEERWTVLLETLVSPRPGLGNQALGELLEHPLYRHEVARELAENLHRQPLSVAVATCNELGALGSPWALPGLVEVLGDAKPRLAKVVWRALCKLTGQERELSRETWRRWLDS